MTQLERILSQPWRAEPSVALGLLVLVVGYAWAVANRRRFGDTGPVRWNQVAHFSLAMLLILVALHPIIDELADNYSFTAHMVQHLILSMIMPIFFLLGMPAWLWRPLTRVPELRDLGHAVTRPVVAACLFNLYFALLHFPRVYEFVLHDRGAHIASHLFIMASGVIMWWPLFSQSTEWPRLGYGAQMLYLALVGIPQSIVGAFITYSTQVLYPSYLRAPRLFEWTPLEDQQLAGLIMWVGGLMYIFLVLTIVYFHWAAEEEAREQAEMRDWIEAERTPKPSI